MSIKIGDYYFQESINSNRRHIAKVKSVNREWITLDCDCSWANMPQRTSNIEKDWKLMPAKEVALMKLRQ